MLYRSFLFLPATSAQKFLSRLGGNLETMLQPDAIIIDLEDSVPEAGKDTARSVVHSLLETTQGLAQSGLHRYIRINGVQSTHFAKDVDAIASWVEHGVGVMISKCTGSNDIETVMAAAKGLAGPVVIPLIETLDGFHHRHAIFQCGARFGIRHAAFGAGDMSLELGVERDYHLPLLQHVIMSLLIAAKSQRIQLIDAPSRAIPSTVATRPWIELLEDECRWSFANGFSGKLAVHPDQLATIHRIFDCGSKVEWAKQVLADFSSMPDRRSLASTANGGYMGTPTLKRAQAILAEYNSTQPPEPLSM